jgi:hypothetical protein
MGKSDSEQNRSSQKRILNYLIEHSMNTKENQETMSTLSDILAEHIHDHFLFAITDTSTETLNFGKIVSSELVHYHRSASFTKDSDLPLPYKTFATIDAESIVLQLRYPLSPQKTFVKTLEHFRVLDTDYHDSSHPFFLFPHQDHKLYLDPEQYLEQTASETLDDTVLYCHAGAGEESIQYFLENRFKQDLDYYGFLTHIYKEITRE